MLLAIIGETPVDKRVFDFVVTLATASCYICPVPVNCRNMMTWSRELEVVVVKPASSVFDGNDMRACSYSNEHIDVNAGPLLCFCACADPSQQVPKFRVSFICISRKMLWFYELIVE